MVTALAAFATGIWAASARDPSLPATLILAGLLTLSIHGLRTATNIEKSRLRPFGVFCLLWLVAGVLRMELALQQPSSSLLAFTDRSVTVSGVISGAATVRPEGPGEWKVRYPVQVRHLKLSDEASPAQAVTGGLLLSVKQDSPRPSGLIGDVVAASGRIRDFHPYRNPGQADWSAALAVRGIDARLSALPDSVQIKNGGEALSLRNRLANWRNRVQQAMMAAMPSTDASLLLGMLFGGYEGVEKQTAREFAATGIIHILSVSGAHIALLAGAVFWLCRQLGLQEKWAVAPAALAMLAYGTVSGFSAPVLRSVLMGLLGLTGLALGRQASSRQALWLAALAMLIYEPRSLMDISFQLSFGCTAGLLYLHGPIAGWLAGVVPASATTAIAATLAAQLGVLPLLAWYFGTFPLMSLLANLLVAPLLEAVILLGLLAAVLAGGAEGAAHALFVGSSLLLGLAVEINRSLSLCPLGALALPALGPVGGICYYGFIAAARFYSRPIARQLDSIGRQAGRQPVMAILAGGLILALGWGIISRPGPLTVHFIDVGQGDATLIVTPHGRAVMVDTGGSSGASNDFDVGEQVVVPYLRHYGVAKVDWLILTHNHQDHAGGAAAVARFIGVGRTLVQAEETEPPALIRLRQALGPRPLEEPDSLQEFSLDGVRFQLFQVGEAAAAASRDKKSSSGENGRSVVVRVQFGRHSFLLTGDLEGESEKILAAAGLPASTVLKVGHHGARKSGQRELLTVLNPVYAVISVGAGNRFGHPAPETLERLRERPLGLFRTDRDGAVVFRSDGARLRVETYVK